MKENKSENKTKIIINYFFNFAILPPFSLAVVFSYSFNKNVAMQKMKNINMLLYTY